MIGITVALILVVGSLIGLFVNFVVIPTYEDEQLTIEKITNGFSCDLMKEEIEFEEKKNFKGVFYEEMKKQYEVRCND